MEELRLQGSWRRLVALCVLSWADLFEFLGGLAMDLRALNWDVGVRGVSKAWSSLEKSSISTVLKSFYECFCVLVFLCSLKTNENALVEQCLPRKGVELGSEVLEVQESSEMFKFLSGKVFGEPISWHVVGRQIRHLERAFCVLLAQPHIVDVYMSKFGRDALILSNYKPNRLLVIAKDRP